jgi:hypothetical protein
MYMQTTKFKDIFHIKYFTYMNKFHLSEETAWSYE